MYSHWVLDPLAASANGENNSTAGQGDYTPAPSWMHVASAGFQNHIMFFSMRATNIINVRLYKDVANFKGRASTPVYWTS